MYVLGSITSAELQRRISELVACNASLREDGMRHLGAIERLEARGMSYSNEDFDVLSSAKRWCDNS